jgi:DNA-binding NtrC family response regulator
MNTKKTLLFVDDEQEILEILVDLFSEEGYTLHTATHANEALDIVDQYPVDFVLSDLKLPDSNGKELLDQVRVRHPDTVRVLTSGYLDIKFGNVTENHQDGILYLSKPWDLLTLKQLVMDRLDN